MKITIKKSEVSNRIDFEIDGKHFHTNQRGDGCWRGYDYRNQIIGTCDFNLRQKTRSGMRSAIERRLWWV